MSATATSTETIAGSGPSLDDRRREKRRWVRRAGYVAAILALIAASATFFILLGLTSVEPSAEVVTWALVVNGIFLLLLTGAVGWEIARLWLARRRGEAGARLHIRIVVLFALVAVTPAILVAIVANITFAQGADHWFSSRSQQIVESSQDVAGAYVQTQLSSLGEVVAAMKREFGAQQGLFLAAQWTEFQQFINSLPAAYGVPGVFLIDQNGEGLFRADYSATVELPAPPEGLIADALAVAPEVFIIPPTAVTNEAGDTRAFAAGAVVLDEYAGLLLFVVAEFDPLAVGYLQVTVQNNAAYQDLLDIRTGMQRVFGLIYFGVALMVLAAAIWMGLAVANRLVSPIGRLINAADEVAEGDLSVAVSVDRRDGDLATLGSSFNKMTEQLASQRSELLTASQQIDSRRRFIEAVLSGVTAGVIGIDGEGRVTLFNRSALTTIDKADSSIVGSQIEALVPELGPVMRSAAADRRLEHRDQITLLHGGRSQTINVRVTTEQSTGGAPGYVITLDDITDLLTAQRTSVWADVARRIAHEIKNPLTPIQLSAERLKRKFGARIEEDRQIFDQCTDTIIRQVGDIGRMVEEFSSFARMPKPTLEIRDIREGLRDAVFLMQVGHPTVEISVDLPEEPMTGRFDMRLISQVITNLIKNGVEAIDALAPPADKGRILIRGYITNGSLVVDIMDNGVGLPRENRQMLLEPYMTTREKGTGLGLAIVRKIVEEHTGTIELMDAPSDADGRVGAMVRLTFPNVASASQALDNSGSRAGAKADADEMSDLASVAE